MRVGAEAYSLNLIIEGDKNLTLGQVDDINLNVKMEIEGKFPEIRYTHVTMIEDDTIDDWKSLLQRCKKILKKLTRSRISAVDSEK